MNILAIDAGNSRLKWGLADAAGWARRGMVDTAAVIVDNALAIALRSLPPLDRVVVSNVAGDAVRQVIAELLPPAAHPPQWVRGAAAQCGVRSGYADPQQLGADRWAALIAAWRLRGRAALVVNAGTTLTADALSHDGVFLGGVIVPGLDLMHAALDRGTAQLRLQTGAFHYFPDNTADAIASGALNALAGAVERMRQYMTETGQGVPLILLSGGAAPLLLPCLQVGAQDAQSGQVEWVDNLVLEGLLEIARDSG